MDAHGEETDSELEDYYKELGIQEEVEEGEPTKLYKKTQKKEGKKVEKKESTE